MSEFDRNLAIVIGINDYQNGIDKLNTAVPDAVAIAFTTNGFDQIMNKDNQQTERPTFAKFKKKALENSEVKKEYEALTLTYQLRKILLSLKKK